MAAREDGQPKIIISVEKDFQICVFGREL